MEPRAAASIAPRSNIEQALQDLSEVAASLDIRACDLVGILSPVMVTTPNEKKTGTECRPPYPVPLAATIQTIADRLSQTNRVLSDIMDRLDFRS